MCPEETQELENALDLCQAKKCLICCPSLGFGRGCCSVAESCLTLFNPMDCSPPGSSVGFSRQEHWSGLLFSSPGDLPDPGMKLVSPASPTSAGGFFTNWATWEAHVCMLSCFSHVWLFATPRTVVYQAPVSLGFYRQEYWNGLPCPPPGYLSKPGIKPNCPVYPALAGRFFITSTTWEAHKE